jgi:hypothetical protein
LLELPHLCVSTHPAIDCYFECQNIAVVACGALVLALSHCALHPPATVCTLVFFTIVAILSNLCSVRVICHTTRITTRHPTCVTNLIKFVFRCSLTSFCASLCSYTGQPGIFAQASTGPSGNITLLITHLRYRKDLTASVDIRLDDLVRGVEPYGVVVALIGGGCGHARGVRPDGEGVL